MSPSEHAEAYFGLLEDLESLFGRKVDLVEVGTVRNLYLRREIEERQETLARPPSQHPTCGSRSMKLDRLLEEKREEIRRIAAEHGARDVRVFGSVARGEAGRESDIDFLVDLEPGRSLLDLGDFRWNSKTSLDAG